MKIILLCETWRKWEGRLMLEIGRGSERVSISSPFVQLQSRLNPFALGNEVRRIVSASVLETSILFVKGLSPSMPGSNRSVLQRPGLRDDHDAQGNHEQLKRVTFQLPGDNFMAPPLQIPVEARSSEEDVHLLLTRKKNAKLFKIIYEKSSFIYWSKNQFNPI
ncbi:unnamed protein product [Paramecium pentaurelia]|uniref:Uncharacterized protein n=1 Tax=Paramecium pentaurelia TaxID=43138 RepID=A0A8S1V8Z0_9CILI|nr:unnamed protein product [Paramecium pentaurelia]